MADNPQATLGAVTAGRLSLNEIFPSAVSSKTGLETAWAGTPEGHGQENLGPEFPIRCPWDFALEADRKVIAKTEPRHRPQGCGSRECQVGSAVWIPSNHPLFDLSG